MRLFNSFFRARGLVSACNTSEQVASEAHSSFTAPRRANKPRKKKQHQQQNKKKPRNHKFEKDGAHEADREEVNGWQGSPQTARDQSRQKIDPSNGRSQEAAPLPARHRRAARDQAVPEIDRFAGPQAALPALGARDRPGLQERPAFPRHGRFGAARIC